MKIEWCESNSMPYEEEVAVTNFVLFQILERNGKKMREVMERK